MDSMQMKNRSFLLYAFFFDARTPDSQHLLLSHLGPFARLDAICDPDAFFSRTMFFFPLFFFHPSSPSSFIVDAVSLPRFDPAR